MRDLRQFDRLLANGPSSHGEERALQCGCGLAQRMFRGQCGTLHQRREVTSLARDGCFDGGAAFCA